jgi:capsule biosynthesis phosphatase
MQKKEKIIVFDIDGTITKEGYNNDYPEMPVSLEMKEKMKELKGKNYWIILSTSRNMNTYQGNIGLINKYTAPVLLKWLEENDVPYDEIHFGKPWCGKDGFYVDDRAIRPREFISKSIEELTNIVKRDKA